MLKKLLWRFLGVKKLDVIEDKIIMEVLVKMIKTEVFPYIRRKIDKLLKITNEYRFYDLVKAVYCISLCINNRSVLESCLALNASLIEHEEKGSLKIETFDDFKKFFDKIYDFMKPEMTDDYTVEDFGEVRIRYNDKFYRVIVGTGHNNVFACLNFLPALAKETSHEEELKLAFEYTSGVINYFLEVNKNDGIAKKRFVLPSEELFYKVQKFFREECKKYDILKLNSLLKSDEAAIEKMHFVCREDNVYPLYNVSLLIDLYDIWENEIEFEQQISVANIGIIDRIYSLFETDRSNKCLMFAPAMMFPDQKYDPDQKTYTFIAKASRGVVVAINADEYKEGELEKEIENIEDYHKSGTLQIAETYNRFDDKGLRGLYISSDIPIQYLIYNSFMNPNQTYMSLGEVGKRKICTALDVIYYLNFMDDTDELFEYLSYSKEGDYERSFGFGSDAAFYFTWKNQGRYIAKGAIVYNMIDVGYDTENEAVVDYFREELRDYPFHVNDYLFREPFSWKIERRDIDTYEYTAKHGIGFGGVYFTLPRNNYVFLTNNVDFYKDVEDFGEYRQWIQLLEEIIIEGFASIKCIFEDDRAICNTGIQMAFMPIEYAIHAGHESFLHEERTYVYSDAQYHNRKWIIRYVVKDMQQIFQDIQKSEDRSIEFNILEEILCPLLVRNPELKEMFEKRKQVISLDKKKIGVFSTSVEYKWDNNVQNFSPKDYHYHNVRKRIANICYDNMIKPGTYHGKQANQIIRAMQKALIQDFENEVSKFSWNELHCMLLDYHSTLLHDININWKRYGAYSGLDEEKDKEVRDRIIDQREKSKHDDRNVLYLIETNSYLNSKSEIHATTDDINFLLAYANWLVVLNNVADMCYFADDEAYIEITDEYVVDTLPDDQDDEESNNLHHRIYSYSDGLKRDKKTDINYLEKVKGVFKEDTGFDFQNFLDVLSYFSYSFSEDIVKNEGSNVLRASMKDLLSDFLAQMNGAITEEDARNLFDYLVIVSQNLKTVGGKEDFYLPIGKRRTRNVRFELMPLVSIGGDIIFSPITMEHLKNDWLNGIMDFVLPHEVGMNRTKQLIVEWKNFYEKQIVYDIAKAFEENRFDIVKMNFELRKLDKSHPQWLGDYDVFAVDKKYKSIWIVECKVIEKVATFYDMYRQQNRFFNEHKEDEKFQRRIDYLQENADQVIQQLGFTECMGYKVIPYMCMNKVLVSRYKEIAFPIVSYSELIEIISSVSRD